MSPPVPPPEGRPARAALYLRVSTGRQAESDLSIPDQRRQLRAYCEARGWEAAAEYVEPGASATDDKRPEFQRLIDAALHGGSPFEVVLVHSFSRFFRDQFQLEFYVRKLAKAEARLVSINPGAWRRPDKPHGPPDHGAVRRVPVARERQAYLAGDEGERTTRLLERLPPADRLPRGGGRAARGQDQEDPRRRSGAGRDGPADLPPGAQGRRRARADGAKSHRQPSQRDRPAHPRRRPLGGLSGASDPHPNDLLRRAPV